MDQRAKARAAFGGGGGKACLAKGGKATKPMVKTKAIRSAPAPMPVAPPAMPPMPAGQPQIGMKKGGATRKPVKLAAGGGLAMGLRKAPNGPPGNAKAKPGSPKVKSRGTAGIKGG